MFKRVKRLTALILKELIQMLRDRITMGIIMLIPVIELFLFAYAVDLTVDHIPTAVADLSLDSRSYAFVDALTVSGFFDIELHLEDEEAVIQAIDEGWVRAGVVIPPDFAGRIERGDAQALVLLDGSDSFTVQAGYSAALAVAQNQAMNLMVNKVERMGMDLSTTPITTATRVLYNPNMDDMIFIVPAIAGILMQLMAVNLTAVAVVRERELGTIEQILVTPTRPLELMIAKLIPNIIITAIALLNVVLLGIIWFGVPFQGDPWLFAWLSLVYLASGLGLGLLISTVAQNQKQAQQISMLLTMLSMMLTGFIYPIAPMPAAIRTVSKFIPLTYYIRIIRGIFTKGVGLEFLRSDAVTLGIYGAVVLVLAAATFKKRLD